MKLVSITDVFSPNGRTTFEVTWDLSVRKIDDNSCEYTNHVTACATEPFLAFIEERGSSGGHDTDAFRAFLVKEESSRSSGQIQSQEAHPACQKGL